MGDLRRNPDSNRAKSAAKMTLKDHHEHLANLDPSVKTPSESDYSAARDVIFDADTRDTSARVYSILVLLQQWT